MTTPDQRSSGWIVGRVALVCGILGLLAGFVRGLFVYAPTAWAAAFEVGIPATVVGAMLGLAIAGVRHLARRHRTPAA
jgi:nitrate reductase gamma subunit